jgi:hypothetical protein
MIDEVAAFVVFVAGPLASAINGAALWAEAAWCDPPSNPLHFRLTRFRNVANFDA